MSAENQFLSREAIPYQRKGKQVQAAFEDHFALQAIRCLDLSIGQFY